MSETFIGDGETFIGDGENIVGEVRDRCISPFMHALSIYPTFQNSPLTA